MLDLAGVPPQKFRPICSAIDKLDKEPWEAVRAGEKTPLALMWLPALHLAWLLTHLTRSRVDPHGELRPKHTCNQAQPHR